VVVDAFSRVAPLSLRFFGNLIPVGTGLRTLAFTTKMALQKAKSLLFMRVEKPIEPSKLP
jgi:hypothetical protein